MSDDNSNDVIMVESNEEDSKTSRKVESRPLMQLFQRLISNDNKQNTVLTNAQIISILHKEFNIDITTLHELEIDIYLNVVKKFLKDWPMWDEFDRGVNQLRKYNDFTSIKQTLENKHNNLIKYLGVQLDATRPLAAEAVKKILDENMKKMEQVNTSDIVLDVYCTRRQLNELIYTRPNPNFENNVFNFPENEPTTISLKSLPMEAILNWWGVQVTIELKAISLYRSTIHQLKHTLVNKKNGPRNLKQILNQNIQRKDLKRASTNIKKEKIYNILDNILSQNAANSTIYSLLQSLFTVIKSDLEIICSDTIPVPESFRQHSNKYPYYRRLCKEPKNVPVSSSENLYDLYIEETVAPMHLIHIGKIVNGTVNLSPNLTWLTVECGECECKFNGLDISTALMEHFNMHHANEPDWTCTNCEETFHMMDLAEHRWSHDCNAKNK